MEFILKVDLLDQERFLSTCNKLNTLVVNEADILQQRLQQFPATPDLSPPSNTEEQLLQNLRDLSHCLENKIVLLARELFPLVHFFDFSSQVRANGYRSFLLITERCCTALLGQLQALQQTTSFPFRFWMSNNDSRTFLSFCRCLHEIGRCLVYTTCFAKGVLVYMATGSVTKMRDILASASDFSSLISLAQLDIHYELHCLPAHVDCPLMPPKALLEVAEVDALLDLADEVDQEVFYGRCMGFQYCTSAKNVLTCIATVMAGYSESYEGPVGSLSVSPTIEPSPPSLDQSPSAWYWPRPLSHIASHFLDPDARARRLAYITRHASVHFCKQFWALGDLPIVVNAPLLILPSVDVGHDFTVPIKRGRLLQGGQKEEQVLEDILRMKAESNQKACVRLRLLCTRMREEQRWCARGEQPAMEDGDKPVTTVNTHLHHSQSAANLSTKPNVSVHPLSDDLDLVASTGMLRMPQPSASSNSSVFRRFFSSLVLRSVTSAPSTSLVIHCHGGGFVGQSAKAHDIYLRDWAERLDCPIISVDYSLAPECPFPQAVYEALFTYCWCIHYGPRLLGSTVERIVLLGDSAGASLQLGVMQLIVQLGLPRPCGLVLIYSPTLVKYVPSPSRLLSVLDPLLPVGILCRCLLAYVGVDEMRYLEEYKVTNSSGTTTKRIASPLVALRKVEIPSDPLLSPLMMSDEVLSQFPRMVFVGCHLDPLLDDYVEFAKRCRRVRVPVTLRVMDDVPHGFLNFILLSEECRTAAAECLRYIQLLLASDDDFTD